MAVKSGANVLESGCGGGVCVAISVYAGVSSLLGVLVCSGGWPLGALDG
jgi:hypothetical protein